MRMPGSPGLHTSADKKARSATDASKQTQPEVTVGDSTNDSGRNEQSSNPDIARIDKLLTNPRFTPEGKQALEDRKKEILAKQSPPNEAIAQDNAIAPNEENQDNSDSTSSISNNNDESEPASTNDSDRLGDVSASESDPHEDIRKDSDYAPAPENPSIEATDDLGDSTPEPEAAQLNSAPSSDSDTDIRNEYGSDSTPDKTSIPSNDSSESGEGSSY